MPAMTRRAHFTRSPATTVIVMLSLVLLSACSRPALTGISAPVQGLSVQRIFVATQRTRGQAGQIFGERRSHAMNFGRVNISIPPGHKPGHLERTSGIADPKRFFAPVGFEPYANVNTFASALHDQDGADGGIMLFVHGYNTTLEDAALRLAQIRHDFGIPEPGLLFSWPSAGDPRGYVYDRDSVLFARDGFERLLRDLHRRGHRRILLVAHSMGSYLTMETLRQLALKGDRRVLGSIEGVFLMAPDIDPDVFRRQARAIGRLPQPFIIMTSRKDRVLNLAGLLTGRKPRLGRIEGPEAVKGLNVTVMDFTQYDDGREGGHNVAFISAGAIRFLKGMEQHARAAGGDLRDFALQGKERRGRRRPATN